MDRIYVVSGLLVLLVGCGADQLVRTEPLAPGGECEAGGTTIYMGEDADGDGVLGDDEIFTTDHVCNGVDGADGEDAPVPLVRVDDEAAGENCSAGGLAVHTGFDIEHPAECGVLRGREMACLCFRGQRQDLGHHRLDPGRAAGRPRAAGGERGLLP